MSSLRKRFLPVLILILVVLISYGQILGMNFWQDDNAVAFKFTHQEEEAGYLGKGFFGSGPYRYTVTSYFPIFRLFGYDPLPYFAWALLFFTFSTVSVYLLFLTIFKDRSRAFLGGLVYAAGYVASDGFIRIFNSVLTSLSVIFVCGTVASFYNFYKLKKISWYLLTLLFYLLAIEIGYIRTHFLIAVILGAEFIFFTFIGVTNIKKLIRNIAVSLIRMAPFIFLFHRWYLVNGDSRSDRAPALITSILKGELFNTFSFFSSLGNIFLSNEFVPKFSARFSLTDTTIVAVYVVCLLLIFGVLTKRKAISLKFAALAVFITSVLLVYSTQIFAHPGLIGGVAEKVSLYFGISFLLLSLVLLKALPEKKLALLFLIWGLVNLFAYGSYIPIYAYPSDNRYLLQTFIPLVGLLILWAFELKKKFFPKSYAIVPVVLVLVWGGINLLSAVSQQQGILTHRSQPSKRFFAQMKEYMPVLPKGSIVYVYIPDKSYARAHYENSFSVAQMPEETAIAWRYGLDRYDFYLVNTYEDLVKKIEQKKIPNSQIFAFMADPDNLINITEEIRMLLSKGATSHQYPNKTSEINLQETSAGLLSRLPSIKIEPENISIVTPVKLSIKLQGVLLPGSNVKFPYRLGESKVKFEDRELFSHYLDFGKWKEDYYQNTKVSASTSWKKFIPELLLDKDAATYWEADRLAWQKRDESITIELKQQEELVGIYYKLGPQHLTPTEFEIFVSQDGVSFNKIQDIKVENPKKAGVRIFYFGKTAAKFIKLTFRKTLYNDAPGLSEIIVIPEKFKDIDPEKAEVVLENPFSQVNSLAEWVSLMEIFKNNGLVKVSWKTDGSNYVASTVSSVQPLKYDGSEQTIRVIIPAGGKKLEFLEINPLTIPGNLTVKEIIYENQTQSSAGN